MIASIFGRQVGHWHETAMRLSETVARSLFGPLLVVWCLPALAVEAQEKVPAGSLQADKVFIEYAVYYLPKPSGDPVAALEAALRERRSGPRLIRQPPSALTEPVVLATWAKDVQQKYRPLSPESLKYFGRGLTRDQALAVQKSEHALILGFGHPIAQVWSALGAANEIAESVARTTNGLIWDGETRELFTPDEWRKRRLAPESQPIPDISRHTTIHVYSTGEYVRAITLGMGKFGLPDVVVQNFSWSMNRNMGHLINLLCQSLAEGGQLAQAGEYELNIRAIRNQAVRDSQVKGLLPGANGTARLVLRPGKPEEGDPQNRLVEIGFDHYPGEDVHARQDAMLGSVFGKEDAVKRIDHNAALEAASKRARRQLPALRRAFNAGLAPGEYIQVKVPFATPKGGREWMWVEVTEWKDSDLRGLLNNEPFDIPGLHGGQVVQVREEDVFDYIRRHADGRLEGNETSKIIEKMQGEVERRN